MTIAAVSAVMRRFSPRRVRARLALMYTILFLVGGIALLALTYLLVANVLLPAPSVPKRISAAEEQVLSFCKPLPTTRALLAECKRVIAATGGPGSRDSTLRALRGASVIGLGVLVLVSVGLGWLVSGRALRPVRSLTEAAKRASELRLGQRLALTGPDDELKELADTFDLMLERLDAAFTSQKRFVANAAHELRTPLTAMRTAIEVALAKPNRTPEQLEAMALRVKQSVERAEATIEALLTLATSEAGATAHESIDLATAAEDALDASRDAIDRREIRVHADLEPAPAHGDRVLLERMVANLVENAVRHNHPGGSITVHTLQRSDHAVFEVANTGPVVSPELLPTLFEPFGRAKQRVNHADGVGLGLSIASAIAEAHNAEIEARPRSGGGLEVTVTLPPGQR